MDKEDTLHKLAVLGAKTLGADLTVNAVSQYVSTAAMLWDLTDSDKSRLIQTIIAAAVPPVMPMPVRIPALT